VSKLPNSKFKGWKSYLQVSPFLLFALFPFFWMLITSLKSNTELYNASASPFLIREGITFAQYKLLFNETAFFLWFRNSIIVALAVTGISATTSTIAAYAIARLRFAGAQTFGMAIFITYLIPPTLLFLPLSRLVSFFGVSDTLWALVLTYPTFLIPFGTWLQMGYFRSIPRELEECAMVDGATRIQALLKIILPIALPGILTISIFSFTLAWGHFIYALAFISSATQKVLPVGIATELIRGDVFFWGALMAAALLASVPVVIIYSFFTGKFVAGLTAGATKY
jgi:multiple sugar transport system permease protein